MKRSTIRNYSRHIPAIHKLGYFFDLDKWLQSLLSLIWQNLPLYGRVVGSYPAGGSKEFNESKYMINFSNVDYKKTDFMYQVGSSFMEGDDTLTIDSITFVQVYAGKFYFVLEHIARNKNHWFLEVVLLIWRKKE